MTAGTEVENTLGIFHFCMSFPNAHLRTPRTLAGVTSLSVVLVVHMHFLTQR